MTRLLRSAADGSQDAVKQILPLVYDQLRSLAQNRMHAEKPGHTLQATALVHETYLRLVGDTSASWSCRAQFFRAAAEAMRRILIEHARRRGAAKRGGGRQRAPVDVGELADIASPPLLALDDAIQQLEGRDKRAAEIVELRFYAGLSIEATAHALGLSVRTVNREWAFARAWLYQQLAAVPNREMLSMPE